jgi:hypothetical protein|tara:strand:- start:9477 stop:9614 length:138 start_codon:yes stop_codon:yes gene_type:complete
MIVGQRVELEQLAQFEIGIPENAFAFGRCVVRLQALEQLYLARVG